MKKYLPVLFLIIFLAPSIALASWWNPFSWFSKKNEPSIELKKIDNLEKIVSDEVVNTAPIEKESITPTIIEKIIERPVIKTQTITVQDPKLQAQINELLESNLQLQTKYSSLLTQYNSLIDINTSLRNQLNSKVVEPVSTSVEVSQPVQSGELILNLEYSNGSTRGIKVNNNSNKTILIKHLYLTAKSLGTAVSVIDATKTNPNNCNYNALKNYIQGDDQYVSVPLESPIYLTAKETVTLYVCGANIRDLVGLDVFGAGNILGLPIVLNSINF